MQVVIDYFIMAPSKYMWHEINLISCHFLLDFYEQLGKSNKYNEEDG